MRKSLQEEAYTDVAIVGAGPVGLLAAREVARSGIKVSVFEEHSEVGVPSHCAGLISVAGVEKLDLKLDQRVIINRVRGALFHSPGGLTFSVKTDGAKAFVVNREAFDKFLADEAQDAGADIYLNSKVRGLICVGTNVVGVRMRERTVRSKITIDCEGGDPKLTKEAGLVRPREILPAAQFEVESEGEFDPDCVEVFLGSRVAPGFFAYVVPLDSSLARIGLASKSGSPRELLKDLLKKRLRKYAIKRVEGGFIITSGPISRTYANGFIAIGDASGQTKPTTGGGIITGGICARIAGRVSSSAVTRDDCSAKFLKKYQLLWKKKLGREFRVMRLARLILNNLPDKAIDRIFKVIIENDLQRLIEKRGDVDFQSGVLMALAKSPVLLKVMPSILKGIVSILSRDRF